MKSNYSVCTYISTSYRAVVTCCESDNDYGAASIVAHACVIGFVAHACVIGLVGPMCTEAVLH